MWTKLLSYIPDWKTFMQAGLVLLIPLIINFGYNKISSLVSNKNNPAKRTTAGDTTTPEEPLSGEYERDLEFLKKTIGTSSDVHFREFQITGLNVRACLVFVDGMQTEDFLNTHVMQVLMREADPQLREQGQALNTPEITAHLKEKVLPLIDITAVTEKLELTQSILKGFTALLLDGMPQALLVGLPNGKTRAINEPTSEALLRGSRIGFTEVLSENTAMLRMQGKSENLEMKSYVVGSLLKKNLVLAYFRDIVNPELLQEVEERITKIDIDFIAESGYVEQLIEDNPLSPFQQVQNTERPDRVINALLEGRVAILVEGTPFALIVPVTFSMLLQSPEDYFERWMPGSLLRTLRFFASFLALMAPALYISFISFHPGLIPTELAITIIEARQGVPFPSLIEVLILEISIEILREAGLRLPKPIGPAMGIVGGLIIGEAAVQAGIVSPFLVIVVAVTAISSFSIPMYSAGIALRVLRFAGMLFAATLGMFGTILFFLLICSHISKLKSFGVPYITPFSPFRLQDFKDLFVRAPLTLMKRRPEMMKTENRRRRS
ncbi:putative membrane protein YndD [Paenibacillus faecis]|uniref:spore germination protein n=1 Tax=Paenibacillus faecis TaxID=862114 RepID=UPI001B053051|nr:spore germination protein [Paenibacillus faecis]GIO83947.1 putative membrane protein YndD [Paenibacillus faecis]